MFLCIFAVNSKRQVVIKPSAGYTQGSRLRELSYLWMCGCVDVDMDVDVDADVWMCGRGQTRGCEGSRYLICVHCISRAGLF